MMWQAQPATKERIVMPKGIFWAGLYFSHPQLVPLDRLQQRSLADHDLVCYCLYINCDLPLWKWPRCAPLDSQPVPQHCWNAIWATQSFAFERAINTVTVTLTQHGIS